MYNNKKWVLWVGGGCNLAQNNLKYQLLRESLPNDHRRCSKDNSNNFNMGF